MNARELLSNFITVVLAGIVIFVVLSQVFGFPSPIAFVATDSMEPVMNPGDGFIGIPTPLAGDLSEGDVVTYEAQTIQGGGLTTHRIDEVTESGYVTQGDANAVTDQEDGEPIVKRPQISLVALQINDQVVTIPSVGPATQFGSTLISTVGSAIGLGDVSSANTGLTVGLAGLAVVVVGLGVDLLFSDNSRAVSRSVTRQGTIDSRLILIAILLALSLPIVSVMAIPSGGEELTVLSTEYDAGGGPLSIEAGGTTQIQSTVENSQPFPIVVILQPQTDGISYSDSVLSVPPGETAETQVTITAPEQIGSHVRARSEHHYIHILPIQVIQLLHEINPNIATIAIVCVLLSPIVLLFYISIGFRQITVRDASR